MFTPRYNLCSAWASIVWIYSWDLLAPMCCCWRGEKLVCARHDAFPRATKIKRRTRVLVFRNSEHFPKSARATRAMLKVSTCCRCWCQQHRICRRAPIEGFGYCCVHFESGPRGPFVAHSLQLLPTTLNATSSRAAARATTEPELTKLISSAREAPTHDKRTIKMWVVVSACVYLADLWQLAGHI